MSVPHDVWKFVDDYISSRDLPVKRELLGAAAQDGPMEMRLAPSRSGAASLTILVTPFGSDRYGIYIYIGEDQSPIEIEWPVNVNRPEKRPALEDLADVLDSVTSGEAYEEIDGEGNLVGCNIWDPERLRHENKSGVASRRFFAPWV